MKHKRLLFLLVLLMTAVTGAWAQTGMINGLFSVSATKRVYFSKGNLQYDGTNWKFAASQWEVLGANGTGASGMATNYPMDLFTWGNIDSPTYNGTTYYTENADLSGIADWGSRMGSGWYTLSKDEWLYLFGMESNNTDKSGHARYRKYFRAKVNGVSGIVVLPDDLSGISDIPAESSRGTASTFNGKTYTTDAWSAMESAGCVFLPAAGFRKEDGTTVSHIGLDTGFYWTSTAYDSGKAFTMGINSGNVDPANNFNRTFGFSVRLVIDQYYLTLADGTKDAAKWTASTDGETFGALPIGGLKGDETVTLNYTGRLKVKSVKAEKKGVDPAKAYLKWDATKKELVEAEIPAGATTVTSSTTDVTWDAGTYVVEGEVAIGGRITLNGNVELIIKDDAKLTVNQIYGGDSKYNLSIYGQANQTGQLIVNSSGGHAIYLITTLNVHSCQVTATSSGLGSYGFSDITTINVYGGSVDAESTGDYGNGIKLPSKGSMNIYGGEIKVVGKGNFSGIGSSKAATVTVYGGKLWAENAGFKAIDFGNVTLTKGDGFTGKIEYSSNNSTWSETKDTGAKYVRVGY